MIDLQKEMHQRQQNESCISLAKEKRLETAWARDDPGSMTCSAELVVAAKTRSRMQGLLFAQPHNKNLLLLPCNDVHTVGMRHAIDVAFINQEGFVIESHCAVGPLRRLRNRRAIAVVERFSSCETSWFSVGEQLMVSAKKGVEL